MELMQESRISAEATSVHRLLGPDDVAKWLGVSSGWVRDHATRKYPRLKTVKVGKLLRFRPEDVEDFLRAATSEIGEQEPQPVMRNVDATDPVEKEDLGASAEVDLKR